MEKRFNDASNLVMEGIEDDTKEAGTIIQEIQPGFMFGDRLLRPSFVGISKKKGEKNGKNILKNAL